MGSVVEESDFGFAADYISFQWRGLHSAGPLYKKELILERHLNLIIWALMRKDNGEGAFAVLQFRMDEFGGGAKKSDESPAYLKGTERKHRGGEEEAVRILRSSPNPGSQL